MSASCIYAAPDGDNADVDKTPSILAHPCLKGGLPEAIGPTFWWLTFHPSDSKYFLIPRGSLDDGELTTLVEMPIDFLAFIKLKAIGDLDTTKGKEKRIEVQK